jgi:hypothetical protein
MGTSHRLPKSVSKHQLDKQNYRGNQYRNNIGTVTSGFHMEFSLRHQQGHVEDKSVIKRTRTPAAGKTFKAQVSLREEYVLLVGQV